MDTNSSRRDIEVIREVFTYINRFKNKTFVIKIDNEIVDYEYFPVLLKDLSILHQAGIRIIIVPGARQRIDDVLSQYGIATSFYKDIRITDSKSISFVKMAAFDVSNKVMTGLSGNNVNALVGNWVRAKSLGVVEGVDYMNSGAVDSIQIEPLLNVMDNSFIPIFPCIGWNSKGRPYNLSSDELAVSISEIVGAEKLFFITSDPVLKAENFKLPSESGISHDGRISRMNKEAVVKFLELNQDNEQGLHKVKMALDAVRKGVRRVHILNGKGKGVLLEEIFSNLGVGTMVHGNEFDRIRKMVPADIPGVLRIMEPFIQDGTLVARDRKQLLDQLDSFFIYETDSVIHGCASLIPFSDGSAEIAGVAVDRNYVKLGIGKLLINYLKEQAELLKLDRIFLLTTKTSDWFETLGFSIGEISDLPEEKKSDYNYNRNSRILIYKLNK